MKKVKRIFIKISRVCFAIFLGMLMIFVVFAMINEPEEVPVPTILGLGFVLSVIALVVCLVIACILDFVEGIRREKISYLKGYTIMIAAMCIVFIMIDYTDGQNVNLPESILRAVGWVCIVKAGDYILGTKK